jgi:hypothetical protein
MVKDWFRSRDWGEADPLGTYTAPAVGSMPRGRNTEQR